MARAQASGSTTRASSGVRVPAPRHSWDPPAAPPPLVPTKRRRIREVLGTLMVLSLVPLVALVGTNLYLVNRLDRIDGAFDGLRDRPAAAPGETILMVGTRPGGRADVGWLDGVQSIESVMLVEVDADGTSVDVRSLPVLDGIAGSARTGRPSQAVAATEAWSGRRVDHVLALDWRTFAQLAADNGIPDTYRYGSPLAAQHDYLRAVLEGTLHAELRKQPLNLYRALSTVAGGAAVDDEWSLLELDRFVVHLRDLRSAQIAFSTADSAARSR
ncbi:hypothetical protein J2X46_001372 [Nocardioides sp. BE266]|uniref:hypothetical protein n=1 Tax=Nocardioides sp. BE266 TaxID=2817725 RepID=UPI0028643C44|nr:hypothetical protein [Nocardioides sp. BE266]MDR7252396.1 hypothetical protein [Nocardioides sp. BE266]